LQSDIRVVEVEPQFYLEKARTPLKFGGVVMDAAEVFKVRVRVENRRGRIADGWGAIFLSDVWAWPSPVVPHDERAKVMRRLSERYADLVSEWKEFAHPITIATSLEDELKRINQEVCNELGTAEQQPFLGALVCFSPLDAALHDAFGNVNGIDTYQGYGPEFMEKDLSVHLGPQFKGKYPADYIRPAYMPRIEIFHLVGGLDKLTRDEVDDTDPDDGLPVALEDWIQREGLHCLKIKLRGNDLQWDIDRTLAVYRIGKEGLARLGRQELYLTVDTNEMCESPDYMIEMLMKVREADPAAFNAILYVEQPTERDLTRRRLDMSELGALKPVILDESLTDMEAFELARELGWTGIGLKTCKGQSNDLLFIAKASELGMPYVVVDLTNPDIALIHSVGLAARIHTIKGVEYNSRQFFPAANATAAKVHPELFGVRDGTVTTQSLQGTGLGYQMDKIMEAESVQ